MEINWIDKTENCEDKLSQDGIDGLAEELVSFLSDDGELEQCFAMEGENLVLAHRVDNSVILLDCLVCRAAVLPVTDEKTELKLVD